MDVKEKLEQLAKVESELDEYFGGMISEIIRDMTDQYWTVFGEYKEQNAAGFELPFNRADSVGWSDESPLENPESDREHIYQEDVRSVVRRDGFTLICIRTSTGDGCEDFIFDNTKEITEEDLNP